MELVYNKGHIKALDGFRGIAIVLVLLFHLYGFDPVRWITILGWIGVDVFFVLSGFLITGILLDNKQRNSYYKVFMIRRILRIVPLYYLVLVLFFIISRFVTFPGAGYLLHNQLYFWTYTPNYLFAFYGWPKGFEGLNHFWSLAIEEQFYLFWPFLVFMLNPRQLLFACIFFIAASILVRNLNSTIPFAYVFTFARLDGLAIGAIAAISIRSYKELLQKWVMRLLLLASASLAILLYFSRANWHFSNPLFIHFGYTCFSFFFGCLLVLSFAENALGTIVRKIFSTKVLAYFGKYSYGLYVYHFILYGFLNNLLMQQFRHFSLPLQSAMAATTILILTVIVSYVSYQLFEKKFIRLKERFEP